MAAGSPFGATATAAPAAAAPPAVAAAPAAAAPPQFAQAAPAAAPAPQFAAAAPPAPAPAAPAGAAPGAPTPGLGFGGGDPFSAPSGISGEKITQFEGQLLLIKPTEVIPSMQTKRGTAENVIRANVVVFSGERAGEIINDMLVFQTALKRELTNILQGSTPYLLGRLGKSQAKEGKDPAWIFTPFSDDDYRVAKAWTDAHPGW